MSIHRATHARNGEMASESPAKRGRPKKIKPQSLAFESLPGDPVGKVRAALSLLCDGGPNLRAALEVEKKSCEQRIESISAQIEILDYIEHLRVEATATPSSESPTETAVA